MPFRKLTDISGTPPPQKPKNLTKSQVDGKLEVDARERADMATAAQVKYLSSLFEQAGAESGEVKRMDFTQVNTQQASKMIDGLKTHLESAHISARAVGGHGFIAGEVPTGIFTVVLGEGVRRTIKFADPGTGKYAGKTCVYLLTGPENTTNYERIGVEAEGGVKLWRTSDEARNAVRVLVGADDATLAASGERYALAAERCCRCGRVLTVPASINRGLGPECATKGFG